MALQGSCERCGGDMFRVDDEDGPHLNCLQCGNNREIEGVTEMNNAGDVMKKRPSTTASGGTAEITYAEPPTKRKRKVQTHYIKGPKWYARQEALKALSDKKPEKPPRGMGSLKRLRAFVLWGDTYCGDSGTPQRMCGHCWAELRRESEGGK